MASLLDRLGHHEEILNAIPNHAFAAGMRELRRGKITAAQFKAALDISPADVAALTELNQKLDAGTITTEEVEDVLVLFEGGHYDKAAVKARLGLTID